MKRVRIRRGTLLESEERQRQEEADAAWAKMEEDARKLEATLPPASSSGSLLFSPEQRKTLLIRTGRTNLATLDVFADEYDYAPVNTFDPIGRI